MIPSRHWREILMFMALAIPATAGEAFEAWGFASGTRQADTEANATSAGDEVKYVSPTVIAINRPDRVTGTWTVYILQFCDDKLFLAAKPDTSALSGASFVDALYGLVKQHGNPVLLATDEPASGDNHFKVIEYRWESPSDRLSLIVNAPAKPMEHVVAGMREEHRDIGQCAVRSDAAN